MLDYYLRVLFVRTNFYTYILECILLSIALGSRVRKLCNYIILDYPKCVLTLIFKYSY